MALAHVNRVCVLGSGQWPCTCRLDCCCIQGSDSSSNWVHSSAGAGLATAVAAPAEVVVVLHRCVWRLMVFWQGACGCCMQAACGCWARPAAGGTAWKADAGAGAAGAGAGAGATAAGATMAIGTGVHGWNCEVIAAGAELAVAA